METIHTIDLIQPIKDRWSPVVFADRPVPEEVLDTLFEAARWAPSSFNAQPWRFIVADRYSGSKAFDQMVHLLTPKNQRWAKHAPILMLTVAEVETDRGWNRHAWHDVGLAMGNLLAQATAEGLSVHQMGGFDRQRAQEVLDIPERFEPVAMVAIGYKGAEDTVEGLPERDPDRRHRRNLDDIVFTNQWGQSS